MRRDETATMLPRRVCFNTLTLAPDPDLGLDVGPDPGEILIVLVALLM